MINQWIKNSDKIALIYKGVSYTYNTIIDDCKSLEGVQYNKDGILTCSSDELMIQLLSMIRGLIENCPVYFGEAHELEGIVEEDLLSNVFLLATTSGTTARKKYIYKRKEQWINSFKAYATLFDIQKTDTLFLNGSLAYTANLYSAIHMIYTGGTIVLSNEKNPKKWIETIERCQCTIAYLVPSKLRLLEKAITLEWTYKLEITTAGEALSPLVLEKIYSKCPQVKVHHYYGAAELGHISAITHDELLIRPRSVGKAFEGVEICIRSGVIYGASVYSLSGGKQFDSAYDYGEFDEAGYLYVIGRKDTQINVHGRKFDVMMIIAKLKEIEPVEEILFIQSKDDKEQRSNGYNLYILGDNSKGIKSLEEVIKDYLIHSIPQWQWPRQIKVVPNGIYSETGKYDMVRIGELFA